jgi:hypothetical protein
MRYTFVMTKKEWLRKKVLSAKVWTKRQLVKVRRLPKWKKVFLGVAGGILLPVMVPPGGMTVYVVAMLVLLKIMGVGDAKKSTTSNNLINQCRENVWQR